MVTTISPTMTTGARPMALSRNGMKPVSQPTATTPATHSAAASRTSRSRTRGVGAGSVMVGRDRNADGCHQDPTAECATGAGQQSFLWSVERNGQVGLDVWLRRFAG